LNRSEFKEVEMKLLTVAETAAICRQTVDQTYVQIREDRLPGVVRIGRKILVREDSLFAWLESGGAALPGGWRKAAAR